MKNILKKITITIIISCLSAIAYSSASLAAVDAIQLKFSPSSNPTDAIFVYKRVKNPVSADTQGCPTPSKTNQCYIWKQVGYLAPNTAAYVFIDPPGTKDRFGKPVQYKLAQGTVDKSSGKVIQWTGLCALDPATLASQRQVNCDDANTAPIYIEGYNPDGGPNYATAKISLPIQQTSIGVDYNLSLPVFYRNPETQKEIPLTYWLVNAPNLLSNRTQQASLQYYIDSKARNQSCNSYKFPMQTGKNKFFYTDTLNLTEKDLRKWHFNFRSGWRDSQPVNFGHKGPLSCGTGALLLSTTNQPQFQKVLTGPSSIPKNMFPNMTNVQPTLNVAIFPTQTVYCLNTNTKKVKKFKYTNIFNKVIGYFKSNSTYQCPLMTGFNVQLSQAAALLNPGAAGGGYQQISDLHPLRSNGINYVAWSGIKNNQNQKSPQQLNKQLNAFQTAPLSIGLEPAIGSYTGQESGAEILKLTSYAAPALFAFPNPRYNHAPNITHTSTTDSLKVAISNVVTLPGVVTKVLLTHVETLPSIAPNPKLIKQFCQTNPNSCKTATKNVSGEYKTSFNDLTADTKYYLILYFYYPDGDKFAQTTPSLATITTAKDKPKLQAISVSSKPNVASLNAVRGGGNGNIVITPANFSVNGEAITPDSVTYQITAKDTSYPDVPLLQCGISGSSNSCTFNRPINEVDEYTVTIGIIATKKGYKQFNNTDKPYVFKTTAK